MHYYQLSDQQESNLIVRSDTDVYNLSKATPSLRSFLDLVRASDITGVDIDTIANRLTNDEQVDPAMLEDRVAVPIDASEVWAAGVTYQISEEAREAESGMPDVYLDVYEGDRPEIFFKATPSHTVGHGDDVGVREDSDWNVPEPELGVVLYRGKIVGYTIGNDVSSRSIEGTNPLYLPQAKVYDRCCAIGPCIVSTEAIDDPHDLTLSMTITREKETVYSDETSTSEMVRTCEELVSYYVRHNAVPEAAVLLTGTSLVPEEGFTLREGDRISIEIEGIGTLENGVRAV